MKKQQKQQQNFVIIMTAPSYGHKMFSGSVSYNLFFRALQTQTTLFFFYNQLSCYVWNRCILLCMFKIFQDWGWRMVTVHLDSSIKINMLSYTWIKYPSPSHSNGVFHQTVLKQYRTLIKKRIAVRMTVMNLLLTSKNGSFSK